jgi:hypothetical protein
MILAAQAPRSSKEYLDSHRSQTVNVASSRPKCTNRGAPLVTPCTVLQVSAKDARLYQSQSTPGISFVFSIMAVLIFIGSLDNLIQPQHHLPNGATLFGAVASVALFGWSVVVVRRMGIAVSDAGAELRGWCTRRMIPWDQVMGFALGSELADLTPSELLATPMLSTYLLRVDGTRVRIAGITGDKSESTQEPRSGHQSPKRFERCTASIQQRWPFRPVAPPSVGVPAAELSKALCDPPFGVGIPGWRCCGEGHV